MAFEVNKDMLLLWFQSMIIGHVKFQFSLNK